MTTRTNTPAHLNRQRLVLRDKPRDAPSMEGWRIEVDAKLMSSSSYGWLRSNGDYATALVHPFTLAPEVWRGLNPPSLVWACADPLFETIYVSRELTEEESSTLRRLMAVEVAREREDISDAEHRAILEARMPSLKVAEENARRAAEMIAKYEPASVTYDPRTGYGYFATQDSFAPIKAGQLVTQTAEGKVGAVPHRLTSYDAGDTGHGYGVAFDCMNCGNIAAPKPAAPRVPQVGDEVEVRGAAVRETKWIAGKVQERREDFMEIRINEQRMVGVNTYETEGATGGFIEWRWPEAKREAFTGVIHVPADAKVAASPPRYSHSCSACGRHWQNGDAESRCSGFDCPRSTTPASAKVAAVSVELELE